MRQLKATSCYGLRRDVVPAQCERGRLNLCSFHARCETPQKKNTIKKEKRKTLHSRSQNLLFLINKLLISNKRQKISQKLGANFNTNTSKTTTCVSHHIYCASLTNKACEEGGGEGRRNWGTRIVTYQLRHPGVVRRRQRRRHSRTTPATLNHRDNKDEREKRAAS